MTGPSAPRHLSYRAFRWEQSYVDGLATSALGRPRLFGVIRCLPPEPSLYEVCLRQLLPRGLTYEPAATGYQSTDGSWEALEAAHLETVDAEQLYRLVESATTTAQTIATAPVTTTAVLEAAAVKPRPVWHRVAMIGDQGDLTPFGLLGLSAAAELVGFVRMRHVHWLTDQQWLGPGESDTVRLPVDDGVIGVFNQPSDNMLFSFLPLAVLQQHVLPALTAVDREQGAFASSYLGALVQRLEECRTRGELKPHWVNKPGYQFGVNIRTSVDPALQRYINSVGPDVIPIVAVTTEGTQVSARVTDNASTAAAMLLARAYDFSYDCFLYARAVHALQGELALGEARVAYARAHPFVLDSAHHPPHMLELIGRQFADYHCNACNGGGDGPRYGCRGCQYNLHPACVTDGVPTWQREEGRKRKREQEEAERGTSGSGAGSGQHSKATRGPFFIFSVYYKHGEADINRVEGEADLRRECYEQLQQMMDEGEEDEESGALDAMSVDQLVTQVLRGTAEANEERYNWRAVIEGGRLM